jgi:hypothetical protein
MSETEDAAAKAMREAAAAFAVATGQTVDAARAVVVARAALFSAFAAPRGSRASDRAGDPAGDRAKKSAEEEEPDAAFDNMPV